VPEYWLLNLVESILEVRRDPTVMPHARYGWQYRTVTRVGPGESIVPLSFPEALIAVSDLLP
jgi:hypothetical protein